MKICFYLSYGISGQPRRLGIKTCRNMSCHALMGHPERVICKSVGHLTSLGFPFPYDTPWFCISMFLFVNIQLSISLDWLKAFPQSHLRSKTSYKNTTTIAELRMPFSLSRQWYQVFPPLHIHCANYSNCMCHSGNSAYQRLNDL